MHFRRCTVLIQATPYALAWGSPCMPGCWMQGPARCPRRRGHDEQYARRNISNPNHLRLDGWAGSALAGERAGDSDGALCPRIFHRRSRCRCAIVAPRPARLGRPGSRARGRRREAWIGHARSRRNTIKNTIKNAVTWTALDATGGIGGGAGGNRTRVRKPSTGSSTYLVRCF